MAGRSGETVEMQTGSRSVRPWLTLLLALVGAGCSPSQSTTDDTLRIGAYSVVREVFHDGLLPAFATHWKQTTGRDVRFEESYNASGAQARAIVAGLNSDVAILSHEGDMDLLVRAGRVDPSWNAGPTRGVITRSLVVIGYRPGNPKQIRDWSDLARPGVGVLYPDPKTSGGARWNINAIYGAELLHGGKAGDVDRESARRRLEAVQANIVNMDASGRQSVANFERGMGDALVTYENELLLRRKAGKEIPYVIPPATLLIEGPAALVKSSVVQHGNREVAEAFLAFLSGKEGQAILADYGFRPVADGVAVTTRDPLPPHLFTMAELGGWAGLEEELYGPRGLWTSIFAQNTARR